MIQVTGKIVLLPEPVKRRPCLNDLCYDIKRLGLFRAVGEANEMAIMHMSVNTIIETELVPLTLSEKFNKARSLLVRSMRGDPIVDKEIMEFLNENGDEDEE